MEYLVYTHNVSHSFEVLLYDDVNIELKPRQSIAILGVSGSGKSTILNNIATLLKPNSGTIDIMQYKDIYSLNNKDLLEIRQKILGIIFQAHYLFRGFNVAQNLRVAELIAHTKVDDSMLKDFNIHHTMGQHIGELSGGQQQRLSIARVLTKRPKVIIADEPTGNLDKDTAINVMQYILQYVEKNNAGLILATHDMDIAKLCTDIILLKDKKLEFFDANL